MFVMFIHTKGPNTHVCWSYFMSCSDFFSIGTKPDFITNNVSVQMSISCNTSNRTIQLLIQVIVNHKILFISNSLVLNFYIISVLHVDLEGRNILFPYTVYSFFFKEWRRGGSFSFEYCTKSFLLCLFVYILFFIMDIDDFFSSLLLFKINLLNKNNVKLCNQRCTMKLGPFIWWVIWGATF